MIDQNCQYLISVIQAVICGTQLPPAPPDICWPAFVRLAKAHFVANIAAYGVVSEAVPAQLRESLHQELNITVVREARMRAETAKIFSLFGENHICFMPMKGFILQDYYPSPDLRTMSDIDVLIKAEDADKAGAVMKQCGYTVRFANSEEDAYVKPPLCSIELHKRMVGAEHTLFSRYYADIWERIAPDGSPCRYKLSDEDFYIFHLVHLTKHYITGGTGIRSILDIWVFLNAKKSVLNWDYINIELGKLNLLEFSRNLEALSDYWFGNGAASGAVKEMQEFIFRSGAYGTQENYSAAQGLKYGGSKKIKYYWETLFPNIKSMSSAYPVLRRLPVLLPVMWIYRIIQGIVLKRSTVKKVLHKNVSGNRENNERWQQHLVHVGLK